MVMFPVNCVFEKSTTSCAALEKKNCGRCPFYKQPGDLEESRHRALARLITLPNAEELLMRYHGRKLEEATRDVETYLATR